MTTSVDWRRCSLCEYSYHVCLTTGNAT